MQLSIIISESETVLFPIPQTGVWFIIYNSVTIKALAEGQIVFKSKYILEYFWFEIKIKIVILIFKNGNNNTKKLKKILSRQIFLYLAAMS